MVSKTIRLTFKTWLTKKLGELADVRMGETLIKKDLIGDGMPIFSAGTDIKPFGFTKKNKLVFGKTSIVLSARGAIGEPRLPQLEKFTATQTTIVVTNKSENILDTVFLWRFLQTFDFNILKNQAAIPMMTVSDVNKIEVPLPLLKIQKQIVERIEGLFAKIDKAKELRQKAREETDQIFQSALYQVFSKAQKKWGLKKFKEICTINPSKTELKDLSNNLEVSFIPMPAVDDFTGSIIKQEIKLLSQVKKGYTYFKEGDVLFAKITPCMENGKSAIARKLTNGIGFGSTEFHVLRPSKQVVPEWIHFYIRQPWFREEAKRYFMGTAGQQRVPQEFLEKTEIPLPSPSEQKKIVAELDNLREKVEKLKQVEEEQLKDLEELKKSILDAAFKGELVN